jgi:hypothetical protein
VVLKNAINEKESPPLQETHRSGTGKSGLADMAGVAGQLQLYEVLEGEPAMPELWGSVWVRSYADEVRAV